MFDSQPKPIEQRLSFNRKYYYKISLLYFVEVLQILLKDTIHFFKPISPV